MKLFLCSYYYSCSFESEGIECLVKCETKESALGFVLNKYKNTKSEDWEVKEFSIDDYEIIEIAHECNEYD